MTTHDASPIAEAVRRARDAKGWTQEQLAEEAGLTANGVWMIENGRTHPRRKTIAALAKALDVSERELMGGLPEAPEAVEENPPGLQEMLDKELADPPPTNDELIELRQMKWRGEPDGVSFLYMLQAIRRANR